MSSSWILSARMWLHTKCRQEDDKEPEEEAKKDEDEKRRAER